MNYYPHHIGDYSRDTSHLTMTEDGAYRRLLDICYASEKPLPLDRERLYRLVRARSAADKAAVDIVLGEFFIEGEDGWHQRRVEEELSRAREKSAKASASAGMRWHSDGNANAMRTHSDGNAPNNQKPRTKNQEPKNRETQQRSRGSRLPPDWLPSEILKAWAEKERPDLNITTTIAAFKDHFAAAPGARGVKLDWEATFRNWVRKELAPKGSKLPASATPQGPQSCSYCQRPWNGMTNGYRYCGLQEHYDNARDSVKPSSATERKSA